MASKVIYPHDMPACAIEYIRLVIRKMGYTRAARREVRQELMDHFTDALADCTADDRQKRAEQLIAEFGDPKMLATLIRRGKKRCRPLWKKGIIRSFQGCLVLMALFVLYALWIALGTATPSVDYLAMLNRMNQPAPNERDNAWPDYDRAIQAYKDPPKFVEKPPGPNEPPDYSSEMIAGDRMIATDRRLADVPAYQRDAIRKWLDENDAAWQHFLAGSRKPYCWCRYAPGPDTYFTPLISLELPPLSKLRAICKSGIWRARFALQDGRVDEALDDCLAIARAGRHWQKPTDFIIAQLVGMAISTLAEGEILRVAADRPLSGEQLRRTQQQLDALCPDGYPLLGITSEKICFQDMIQRSYTDGGPGGGHVIPDAMRSLLDYRGEPPPREVRTTVLFTLVGTVQASRDETLEKGNAIYDLTTELSKKTPYERRDDKRSVEKMLRELPYWRYVVLYMIIPSLERASELSYRSKADYDATVTVLALLRYKIEKGRYPDRLDDLVAAGYLRQLPQDPYSAGPLVYRRTGEDFTLYSVAANFTDDGGTPIAENGWDPAVRPSFGRAAKGGDHVFWPVQFEKPEDVAPPEAPVEAPPESPASAPASAPASQPSAD